MLSLQSIALTGIGLLETSVLIHETPPASEGLRPEDCYDVLCILISLGA
jgi:hypothetical protein